MRVISNVPLRMIDNWRETVDVVKGANIDGQTDDISNEKIWR
jgi:hypothetical protein